MCGIFGVISASDDAADRQLARSLATSLLRASETRGREACGIAVHDGERIEVLKQGGSVSDFLASPKLHQLLDGATARATKTLAISGHSRLATNGAQSNIDNNQPVITHGAVALHNGIVVNEGRAAANDILISGDRIERIGRGPAPAGAEVVDLAGRHVLPGIIDEVLSLLPEDVRNRPAATS